MKKSEILKDQSIETCGVCPFATIVDEYTIYDGRLWIVNLRAQDQTLLGTTFITAKRHVHEENFLTRAEWDELYTIKNGLLAAISSVFNPITFNTSCLKNDAFKVDPDNTPPEAGHVHYHVKPRYGSQPIVVNGETFVDPMPGRYLAGFERHRPSEATALVIAQTIRDHLPNIKNM